MCVDIKHATVPPFDNKFTLKIKKKEKSSKKLCSFRFPQASIFKVFARDPVNHPLLSMSTTEVLLEPKETPTNVYSNEHITKYDATQR